MHRPLRRISSAVTGVALVSALLACTLDEAELLGPGTEQVRADLGQLRVLTSTDDPTAGDRWTDVITPDPAVFEEGDAFREDDSRTAAPDEPAERRRLFTATGEGRTLLVELNCRGCEGGIPATGVEDTGLLVWDLVVGDPDQGFSDRTDVARPGVPMGRAPGEHVVVVRPGAEGRSQARLAADGPPPLRLVATHTPDDGADLFVDVYAAVGEGEVTLDYDTGASFPVVVG